MTEFFYHSFSFPLEQGKKIKIHEQPVSYVKSEVFEKNISMYSSSNIFFSNMLKSGSLLKSHLSIEKSGSGFLPPIDENDVSCFQNSNLTLNVQQ